MLVTRREHVVTKDDVTTGRQLPDCLSAGDGSQERWYDILYHFGRIAMAITASEARKNLFPLIEQINEDRTPVEITSKRGDAVLISIDDYRALEETAYLLRSPANVRRLLESLDQAHGGAVQEHELDR